MSDFRLVDSVSTSQPHFLTVSETASRLRVSRKTVHDWIRDEKIRFIRLPGGGDYRIPEAPLLESLGGNYSWSGEAACSDAQTDPDPIATPARE
jgi:excisionase family DNA binding protein